MVIDCGQTSALAGMEWVWKWSWGDRQGLKYRWESMGTPFPGRYFWNLAFPGLKECFFPWERTFLGRKDSFIRYQWIIVSFNFVKMTAWLKIQGPAAKPKGATDFYRGVDFYRSYYLKLHLNPLRTGECGDEPPRGPSGARIEVEMKFEGMSWWVGYSQFEFGQVRASTRRHLSNCKHGAQQIHCKRITLNGTIPHVIYSFLLCNSNYVFKTRRFYDIRLQKISWPWNGVKGHSRSLRVVSFDRLCMVSY